VSGTNVDTSGFFDYPTEPSRPVEHGLPSFLSGRDEEDWALLLDHTETLVFRPGEIVLAAGSVDRALYLLVQGWVKAPSGVVHPITTLGEGAFLDGGARAVTVEAMSDGELLRLSYEGFEALAARNPALGRDILLDLGRILSARMRMQGDATPGWTG
jgi:SulP family sulfate permease